MSLLLSPNFPPFSSAQISCFPCYRECDNLQLWSSLVTYRNIRTGSLNLVPFFYSGYSCSFLQQPLVHQKGPQIFETPRGIRGCLFDKVHAVILTALWQVGGVSDSWKKWEHRNLEAQIRSLAYCLPKDDQAPQSNHASPLGQWLSRGQVFLLSLSHQLRILGARKADDSPAVWGCCLHAQMSDGALLSGLIYPAQQTWWNRAVPLYKHGCQKSCTFDVVKRVDWRKGDKGTRLKVPLLKCFHNERLWGIHNHVSLLQHISEFECTYVQY